MSDFLDIALDLKHSNNVDDKGPQFEKVFSAIGGLQAVHSKAQLDLNNIESIFTVLELGKVINCVPELASKDIPETIAALKDVIVKTLEKTIHFPVRGHAREIVEAPEQYKQFAKLVKHIRDDAHPSHTVSAISFNYDFALDMALFREGLGPDYIINTPSSCINPVPLMKLHGSLNWATQKDKSIRPMHLQDYLEKVAVRGTEREHLVPLKIGSDLKELFQKVYNIEVNAEPVIVPPSWNKADYHNTLSAVWAAAAQHLSNAEHIFVLGYSLPETDSFFRHLYALGSVGGSTLRRIEVFDPDGSGTVNDRFRRLLGPGALSRYNFHARTFWEAVGTIKRYFPKKN